MRVLYDGYIYAEQPAGGINRYFANLIGGLPRDFRPSLTTCQNRSVNYPAHPNLKIFNFRRFRPQRVSYRLEKYYFRHVSAARHFEIVHPTYYSLLTRQEVGTLRPPVVLTVWDMIHEHFPEQLDPHGRCAEEKRRAITAAAAVICISENTKNDLLERYPLDERRVTVTHLASEIDVSLSYGPEPVPSRPYYLYVGSRTGYKNFDGLLSAFAKVAPAQPDFVLCVVGPAFGDAERRRIADLGLAGRVVHYGHVSDGHLAKLYRCAVAFVYPSLYEGFGIPPVEAMSCETAVVASNRSSIPEVVGEAGLLFDPESPDELADALAHLSNSPAERDRLIAKGRERARSFSWEKTVAETLEVYRSARG